MALKVDNNNNSYESTIARESRDVPSLYNQNDVKLERVWKNVLIFVYFHGCALYSLTLQKQTSSIVIAWIFSLMCAFGVTIGAHRLYTHRSFRANTILKVILVTWQTMAVQNSMFEWVRDHRMHHKYTDTNADPHNIQRGFFFAHMGWLMCKKHPDVKKFGPRVDMSDLESDPIVMFQHKHYIPLAILFGFIFPTILVMYFGESFVNAWHGNIFRYLVVLHLVWCINSVAHCFGYKPYDKNISPTESYLVGSLGLGEGWHNYHHVFPFDYKCSELPTHWCNLSLMLIDFFAYLGWATDLKTVSKATIMKRIRRTGDGTKKIIDMNRNSCAREVFTDSKHNDIWGYYDPEMTREYRNCVEIFHPKYER